MATTRDRDRDRHPNRDRDRDRNKGNDPRTGKDGRRDRNRQKPKGRDPDSNASQSAQAILESALAAWGLGELGGWAWEQWLNGDSEAEIMLKIRNQKAYQARFPGMAELQSLGLGINEGVFIQFESTLQELASQYGIPAGVYRDRNAISQMLRNGVSAVEVEDRMRDAASLVYGSPQVRQMFAQFYGPSGDGAAIAYFLDPDRNAPILQREWAAAQVAGNVMANGLSLTKAQAERLATAAGDLSPEEAQRAAAQVGLQRDLFANLMGEADTLSVEEGVSAALGVSGVDAASVEARAARRRAAYAGGGDFASSQSGITGLGSANL